MKITAQRSGLSFQFFKHEHVWNGEYIVNCRQISENEFVESRLLKTVPVKRQVSFWDWLKFRLSNE